MKTIDATGDENDSWMRKVPVNNTGFDTMKQPYENDFEVTDENLFEYMVQTSDIGGQPYEVFFVTVDENKAKKLASNEFQVTQCADTALWYIIALEPIKNYLQFEVNIAEHVRLLKRVITRIETI